MYCAAVSNHGCDGNEAAVSKLVCANPRTGACREGSVTDDDCCAVEGNGGCAPGYTFAGQIDLSHTATTDLDGHHYGCDESLNFYHQAVWYEFAGSTCCVPGEKNPVSLSLSPSVSLLFHVTFILILKSRH